MDVSYEFSMGYSVSLHPVSRRRQNEKKLKLNSLAKPWGGHIIHHRRSSHLLMSAASPSEAKPRRRQNVSYIYNAAIMLVTHEHSLTVNKPEMWTYMINQWHLHPNLFWPHSSSCTSSGSCAEGAITKDYHATLRLHAHGKRKGCTHHQICLASVRTESGSETHLKVRIV